MIQHYKNCQVIYFCHLDICFPFKVKSISKYFHDSLETRSATLSQVTEDGAR